MADGSAALRRPHAPLPRRSRKRWAVAAGVVGCWAVLLYLTGSLVAGTALLLLLGALGAACVATLRSLGWHRDHPWVQQLASRPWRDGQDVLHLGLRHLPDLFVTTPTGALLAPNAVQIRLSPRDFGSLTEVMDIGLVSSSAAELYAEQVTAHGAQFAAPGPALVSVISDPALAAGRYALRQGHPGPGPFPGRGPWQFPVPAPPDEAAPAPRPVMVASPMMAGPMAGAGLADPGLADPGLADRGLRGAGVADTGPMPTLTGEPVLHSPTVAEWHPPAIPLLKLITGENVTQTRTSGACAGRGAVDLVLPQLPTVSREHARFSYTDGQWWVANLGRNGLTLNGIPLVSAHPVQNGDSIRWGRKPDALLSRVEIG